MKTSLNLALAAGLTVTGIGMVTSSASALPVSGLDPAIATSNDIAQGVQDVRWVCGPWGCHWAPGWGYYGGGPGYGWRGGGWHGGWRGGGWRGGGWHGGWRGGGWHRGWHR